MAHQASRGSSRILEGKIKSLRLGVAPRVLDLFAGCGGLTLGFHAAGFRPVGSVELDPIAARTHARNFFQNLPPEKFETHARPVDITRVEPEELLKDFDQRGSAETQVDVIVGGPPCQAFARVGRAKLREIADHPEAFLKDARGDLYLRYLHYVKKLKPVAILMENVPDVLNYGGHNIAEEVCDVLTAMGYVCGYTLLNSVFYGVPQMRERMFLMAIAKEVGTSISFPLPTHWIDLPRGYHGSRQVALQTVRADLFEQNYFYTDPPVGNRARLRPAVSAEEALADLSPITIHLEGKLKRGARRFDELTRYVEGSARGSYAKQMREWPAFEGREGVYDHVIRFLPRDYAIFRRMHPGDEYPEAHAHAQVLFTERLKALARKQGHAIRPGTVKYKELYKATVPPYDPGKFPNKWRKMERDLPARTLMAHLGKDGYSHIHYDSDQARTISVREAARLQSFPDGFIFEGSMNPAFRQIGNAVPPLLARALALKIRTLITEKNAEKTPSEALDCV
jgi:DNA (cytosine-5)-methyltransferase 1